MKRALICLVLAACASTPGGDFIGYGDACGLKIAPEADGWSGEISPADCRIDARSGRAMGIDVRVRVTAKGVRYREAGLLEEGKLAFKVPGEADYDFVRR